jgi:SGNH domain-containing protein
VLVVGDSVGGSFARGLVRWAQQTGKATVLDESRQWCSLGRFLPAKAFGPRQAEAGCDDWGTRWAAAVRTFDPDVAFVMYSIWEVMPRLLPGATDFARPGTPAIDAWQLSEYQRATDVLSARGARVVWFSIACEGGTTIKRGEPLWYVNRRTIPALARSHPSVRLIDLDGFLCNRPHELTDLGGVQNIRPDHAHYSEAGAVAMAGWVMPIVLGETRPPPYASN